MPGTDRLPPGPREDRARPSVDLTVVLYRSQRFVEALAEGLQGQTYPHERVRLWFVENGPEEGGLEALRSLFARWPGGVVALPLRRNIGFTGANNLALRRQRAPFALLLNPDTRPAPTCVEALVARALREPGAGMVEPRQAPREHPKPFDPETGETSWCSLGCCLLLREALERVGPLDDLFFMYCEDVDLSWRMRAAGYRCIYEPAAVYEHFTGDRGRSSRSELFYSFRNQYILRGLWGEPWRAGSYRVWRLLRSYLCRHPLRDGGVIREALRDGASRRAEINRGRSARRRGSPWISFGHRHLGPAKPPQRGVTRE